MKTDINLENYKYVNEYTDESVVSLPQAEELIRKAWQVTPSKNNFMPYNVNVIGPDKQHLKNLVYKKCVGNEGVVDGVENVEEVRYSDRKPRYWNIVSCDILLIFTLRIETEPNSYQQWAMDRGITFEAMNQKNVTGAAHNAKIEIGMFSAALAELCLKNNYDVAHICNFPSKIERWSEEEFDFITRTPLFIMTIGKGKHYRRDEIPLNVDQKPNYDRIVNIV